MRAWLSTPLKRSSPLCEIKIDGEWVRVPADEAHRAHREKPKRCPCCRGMVITAGSYTSEPRISLQHRKLHDGCPLIPRRFNGTEALHPNALA